MEGRTKSIWQCGFGTLCACAILVFSSLNSTQASTLAAPAPKPTSAALATKANSITEKIRTLKKSQQRWIEVNLSKQRLIAWEGSKPIYRALVSTGKSKTPTLTGIFNIQTKLRRARMQGDDYDIKDVPYTMYYQGSYAIHGAYWHDNFGTPVSHGCVNVAPGQARWIFNWAQVGTPVVVHK